MDSERIIGLFTELVRIDSESMHERRMADVLSAKLAELGFEVSEDGAGRDIGSDAGNLYAYLKGTDPGKRPVLFSAHMDTVVPGKGKQPVVDRDKGVITSAGDTVLGSDDVAGIVHILEGVRSIKEKDVPHGDIEVLFTAAEEVYALGASRFDYSKIRSKEAYVVDLSADIGEAAVAAPSIISFGFTITGRASHAGFDPQAGINAIAVASNIIASTKQGIAGDELTLNIGTISGGSASNIVSEGCSCTGEVRGSDHDEACRVLEELKARVESCCKEAGAGFSFDSEVMLRAYRTPESSKVCEDFRRACEALGLEAGFVSTRGGSDNNVFALHGISGIVTGCGMSNTHTTSEYIKISDLIDGCGLVEKLIELR